MRQRLMLVQLFEELRGLGYDGAMTPFGATRKAGARNAAPGWRRPMCRCGLSPAKPISHEVVVLGGAMVTVRDRGALFAHVLNE